MESFYKILVNDERYETIKVFFDKNEMKSDLEHSIIYEPKIVFYDIPINVLKKSMLRKLYWNSINVHLAYSIYADNHFYLQYNDIFHLSLWKYFVPSKFHLNQSKYAFSKGKNVDCIGYPTIEGIDYQHKRQNYITTLIWAPHWSIDDHNEFYVSTFLEYFDKFIDFQEKNNNTIKIVFRPHQSLWENLINHPKWGYKKTSEYYSYWKNKNQFSNGDYLEIFNCSSGIILDSISFLSEYLFTKKPIFLLTRSNPYLRDRYNDYGKDIISATYKIDNFRILTDKISQVYLKKNDPLFYERDFKLRKYYGSFLNESFSFKLKSYISDKINE